MAQPESKPNSRRASTRSIKQILPADAGEDEVNVAIAADADADEMKKQ